MTAFVRPSQLQTAEKCGLAPALAAQFPESSEQAEGGKDTHERIADLLAGDLVLQPDDEASWAAAWAVDRFPYPDDGWFIEHPLCLRDPETDELITQGTGDLIVAPKASPFVFSVDWKSGAALGLPHPNDSLQLGAYGCAATLEFGKTGYVPIYVRTQEREVIEGEPVTGDALWTMIERIKRAASREPVATRGDHCGTCWVRKRCPAWLLPAYEGPTALEPFTRPEGLTAQTAPRALEVVQAMRDVLEVAEGQLRSYAREHGGIPSVDGTRVWSSSWRKGRVSVDQDAMERDGLLSKYQRRGADYEVMAWRKTR